MSLICEIDHLDYLDFLRGIPDESVDLVVTDPPYGVAWDSAWRSPHQRRGRIVGDSTQFSYSEIARESYRVLKPNSAAFFFTRWDVYENHIKQVRGSGLKPREPLIVQRRGGSVGDLEGTFSPYAEWLLFCHKGNFKFRETKLLRNWTRGNGGKRPVGEWKVRFPSCWFGSEYPDATDTSLKRSKAVHSTIKSHKLISWLIQLCSNPGALVVDPFVGSGTTAVAAQMTGRNFIGCDIDGKFVKMARRRVSRQGFFK